MAEPVPGRALPNGAGRANSNCPAPLGFINRGAGLILDGDFTLLLARAGQIPALIHPDGDLSIPSEPG